MTRIRQLGVGLILIATASTHVAHAQRSVVFGGVDVKNSSSYFYLGGVSALNGDLNKDGVLVRGVAAYGNYDYDTTAVASGNVDADQIGLQAGIGYQWVATAARVSLYGGVDYQDHDLDQLDQGNTVRDDEIGAAVQAELQTLGSPIQFAAIGSYSTAFDTYWARARLGYKFGITQIGPEVVIGGNDEYKELRAGAFANWETSSRFGVQASVGYADSEGDKARKSNSSIYGTVGVSYKF